MKKYDIFHYYEKRLKDSYEYVVKKGDTLYKIAKMHGVNVTDLITVNNLQSHLIYPNQIIVIPKSVPNGSVYFEEYVIQINDTLATIADKIGISVESLMKYNDITKMLLAENQVIRIPRTFNTYMVEPGDTLESILAKTNMTLEEFINANIALWLTPGSMINVK